jgi:muramoyltetrapeptide carboxypeptidase
MTSMKILKPGDSVGIIAPSSLFSREKFDGGIEFLKSIGLNPVIGLNVFEKDFIFSGTVAQRLESIKNMLGRKDIKAIWCVRGGAGSYAVAEELAKLKEPKHPKILMGMSDVTALHLLFTQKWKWPVLHTPLFDRMIVSPEKEKTILTQTLFDQSFRLNLNENLKSIGKLGCAVAPLTGGNLALLVSSIGSRWEVQTKGKILFIEDTGERAYRIDRMLTQLKSAGKFEGLKGILVGDFTDCKEADQKELWPIVLERHFSKLKIPCIMGFPSGHGDLRLTIPFGVKIRLDSREIPSFQVLEGYACA